MEKLQQNYRFCDETIFTQSTSSTSFVLQSFNYTEK